MSSKHRAGYLPVSKMESDRSGITEVFQKIEKVEQGIQDYNEQKT